MRLAFHLVFLLGLGQALAGAEPSPRRLPADSVVLIRGLVGGGVTRQGSGVVVSPGVVATNAHVVSNCRTVEVVKGKNTWMVNAFCVEPDRDLCLLSIPNLSVPPALAAKPEDLPLDQPVISVGFPAGEMSTSTGNLIARWTYRGSTLLQSDAPISQGSSGGGLFTSDGRLLGITTFIYGGNGKLNFSIPIDWIGRLQAGGVLTAHLLCPGISRDNMTTEFFEHITEDPANWDSWITLARTWTREAPQDPNAWCAQGVALGLQLRQGASSDNANLTLKLMEDTLKAYQHAVRLGPRLAKAWNNLGVALENLNRHEEAQQAFRKAAELKPGEALPWLNLGSSLINTRNYREAIQALHIGLQREPDEAVSWSRLAYCEGALEQWREAARDYRIALRLSPLQATWWGDLFKICRQASDTEGAALALEKAKALDPALAESLERQPSRRSN